MATATKIAEPVEEKRTVRKLTIEILDQDAVLKAYPGVQLVVTETKVDRKKLRPIVNALYDIGVQVPGIKAYYASDVASDEEDVA